MFKVGFKEKQNNEGGKKKEGRTVIRLKPEKRKKNGKPTEYSFPFQLISRKFVGKNEKGYCR
jgi:hypothetical protein